MSDRRTMRLVVAEDDPVYRALLVTTLSAWGYALEAFVDGEEAWRALEPDPTPTLLLLDWMMPGVDGLELCGRLSERAETFPVYIILVSGRDDVSDLVRGLRAGAHDYVMKPFHPEELRARVRVGARVLELQSKLAQRIHALEQSHAKNRELEQLLPICAYCKNIRSDDDYWQQMEAYLAKHANLRFSHGICPPCYATMIGDEDSGDLADEQTLDL